MEPDQIAVGGVWKSWVPTYHHEKSHANYFGLDGLIMLSSGWITRKISPSYGPCSTNCICQSNKVCFESLQCSPRQIVGQTHQELS